MGNHVIASHNVIFSVGREKVKEHSRHSDCGLVEPCRMSTLALRLRGLRKAAQLTQPQLATASGVGSSTIAEIETGVTLYPAYDTLKKLAAHFEVNIEWLQTGKGLQHPVSSMRDEESELLLLFRALSDAGRGYIVSTVRNLHDTEHRDRPSGRPGDGETDASKKKRLQ